MIGSFADLTPNGSATKLSQTTQRCAWFAVTASAAGARLGDAGVATGEGLVLANGVPFTAPPLGGTYAYDLSQVYVWCAAGATTVSVVFGS